MALNALSGTKLPMSQKQYGISLGGPIVRDRTFYFTNFEQRKLDQTGLAIISDPNVAIINARLAAVGYPGSQIATGIYPNPIHTTNLLSKVDHQVSDRNHFSVRYSLYDVTSSNARGAGALNAPSASPGLDNIDQALAFSNTLALSSRTVNETRAQFSVGDLKALPTDPIGPAVSIAGVASFGTFPSSPQGRHEQDVPGRQQSFPSGGRARPARGRRFHLQRRHELRFPDRFAAAYTFSSLANFLSGVYNNAGFTQTFGETVRIANQPQRRDVHAGRVEG